MRLRGEWVRIKLAYRMTRDGFKRLGEPCPYCHRKGAWLGRDEERICLRCTYGWMYPSTREKFGWGDPGPSLGLYSPWPDGRP